MQLKKLVNKVKFPGIDVEQCDALLLVVLQHCAEVFAVFCEESLLYFVCFLVFGGNGDHDCFGGVHLYYNGRVRKNNIRDRSDHFH